jgi:WD40 repeat protein
LPTLYEILGVNPKAEADDVRSAYRNLAREYHPDLNPDPAAHERMAQINAAFEVLSDPVRRMEYDQSIGQNWTEPSPDGRSERSPEAVKTSLVQRLRAHRTPVYAATYTPQTGRLVTSSFDNEVFWWDANLAEPERKVKLDGGVVSALVALDEVRAVAAGCTEQQLSCWRVNGGRVEPWRQVPKDWAVSVALSPDGTRLAVGSVDRAARVQAVADGRLMYQCQGHAESVTSLAWSADSRFLATGSADASVKIWEGQTGRLLHTFEKVRSTVTAMAFSPDGRWLAVAAVDLSIRIFGLDDLQFRKSFFGHERPIEALAFHPRSWLLGSASRDGSLGLWNVVHGIGHGRIEASLQPLSCLAFHPKGGEMVAGGLDKVLRVWRIGAAK